jgi:SAM-dependent methyltransferase
MNSIAKEGQSVVDAANSAFWNESCGSAAARTLGVTGNDRVSLKKYDDWYFQYYPYLEKYIDFASLRDRDVLEVGLGYGTVAQKVAESSARYTGFDIAKGPVDGSIIVWRNPASRPARSRARS